MKYTKEYFAGTGSFSNVAKKLGCEIHRIELDKQFEAEEYKDILSIEKENDLVDVAWFSPVCTGFSVAVIGRNWDKETKQPKTDSARHSLALLDKTIQLISQGKYIHWFIENPRGMARVVIDDIFKKHGITNYRRNTVTYCQYGDTRMKPTDIWTNCKSWKPKAPCKNGMPCHVSAPRGSRTGTQGLKGAKERSVIPPELFVEIFTHIEMNELKTEIMACSLEDIDWALSELSYPKDWEFFNEELETYTHEDLISLFNELIGNWNGINIAKIENAKTSKKVNN